MMSARPLRLLHLIPSLGGGGAERQLLLLSTELRRRGHQVHVAATRGGQHMSALATAATVHQVNGHGNHDPLLLPRVVRLVRQLKPDVVQTWLPQMDVLGGLAALFTSTTWIISERSSTDAYPESAKNRLRRTLARRADAIVANSRAGLDYWSARTNGRVLRAIVPNAVESVTANGHGDGVLNAAPLILCAGRLSTEKNIPLVLAALEFVRADAQVVICGEGPDRPQLQQMISQLGLTERVTLAGYRYDLMELMARAALLVSASRFEGQPNVVLEAMACGCPLVLSRIPAHRALLGDDAALFFDADDAASLGACMQAVIDDPDSARRRSEAARLRAARHSIAAVADGYEHVYAQVIAQRVVQR